MLLSSSDIGSRVRIGHETRPVFYEAAPHMGALEIKQAVIEWQRTLLDHFARERQKIRLSHYAHQSVLPRRATKGIRPRTAAEEHIYQKYHHAASIEETLLNYFGSGQLPVVPASLNHSRTM